MTTIIELTPQQASYLYSAWYAEQCRIRHEAEFWVGQAKRDVENRGSWRKKAVDLGVPEEQADRFIYSGPMA